MNNRLLNYSKILTITLLSFLLTSCGDDAPKVNEDSSIFGRWILKSIDRSNCKDMNDDGFQPQICTAETCLTFQFNEDLSFQGIHLVGGATQISTGAFSFEANHYSISSSLDNISGTFRFINDNLILTSNDPDTGCDIEWKFER